MHARDAVRALRRRWVLVPLVLLACAGLAVGLTVVTATTEYRATAQLFVARAATDPTARTPDGTPGAARLRSYAAVASSHDVAVDALTLIHTGRLPLPTPPPGCEFQAPAAALAMTPDPSVTLGPQQLAREVSADAPAGTVLLDVHVEDASPQHAAELAAAVAEATSQYVSYRLEQPTIGKNVATIGSRGPVMTIRQIIPSVQLTVFALPAVPSDPISPFTASALLTAGIGTLVLVLLIGGGALLITRRRRAPAAAALPQ